MADLPKIPRLGVNIDHVATIRNARGGAHPDPVDAAMVAIEAGADGITAHLREDRRHIGDNDIARLMERLAVPLNLEMAATGEMLAIALKHRPNAACIVPERRQEVTTEGGLDAVGQRDRLEGLCGELRGAGIRLSLFIEADPAQIEAAAALGADIVELHTGTYCHAGGAARDAELERLAAGARMSAELGLECHAGHGLGFGTVGPVAALPQVAELNIGHFLVGEAVMTGLGPACRRMLELIRGARTGRDG